jgi:nucleoid DNA-binding protein
MTKQDIIRRVREEVGLTERQAWAAVESIFSFLRASMIAGEDIIIRGFGRWKFWNRNPWVQRHNRHGNQPILMLPNRQLRFVAAPPIRAAVKRLTPEYTAYPPVDDLHRVWPRSWKTPTEIQPQAACRKEMTVEEWLALP